MITEDMSRTVLVPAKINLFLDIEGKRQDGYHLVRMLMQTVSLYDRITVTRISGGTGKDGGSEKTGLPHSGERSSDQLLCSTPGVPTDSSNLCMKALSGMKKSFGLTSSYRITLQKKIPMAAGLAGGSADAAGVIRAVASLEGLLSDEDWIPSASLESAPEGSEDSPLRRILDTAVGVGADVPYCLFGGSMLSEGIGERLTPVSGIPETFALLVKPPLGISTRAVYDDYDSFPAISHPDTDSLLSLAEQGRMEEFMKETGNVLETVTARWHPLIHTLEETLRRYGAFGAMMSGSGPTVFGLFHDERTMKQAAGRMRLSDANCEIYETRFTPGPGCE